MFPLCIYFVCIFVSGSPYLGAGRLVTTTVVPLLRDHPVGHTDVVFEEGRSFIRGRKQCKPKHVSSGIVVLNVRWSLIRVVSQEGDYCTAIICLPTSTSITMATSTC